MKEKAMPSDHPYPNREHERADKAARRALQAVDDITEQLALLRRTLDVPDRRVDADTGQGLAEQVRKLTGFLAEMGTLYDVREWHAADRAEEGTRP
jgi:hypothetical protein